MTDRALAQAAAEPDHDFRRLWVAQGVSTFGSLITRAALPLTAALLLHASAAQMALLAAANLVAALLVAPIAGPWLDRRRRRPVMLGCDFARALLLVSIPLVAIKGQLGFGLLLVVQAMEGALTAVFDIAQRSWLPELVGESRLVRANARLATTNSVAEIGSFGVAGWLVQLLGGPIAMAIDALSYLASALALTGIRKRERVPDAPLPTMLGSTPPGGLAAWIADVRDGLRAAFADPSLRALAAVEGMLFSAFGVFMACYILFATRDLAFPAGPLGMIFALGGVGSLIAALAAPRLAARFGIRSCMIAGFTLGAVGLGLCVLAPRGAPAVALTLLAVQQLVGDGGWTLFLVHADSLRMRLAPADARARVAAGSAALAGRFGSRGALALGAVIVALAIPLCLSGALTEGITRTSSDT